jgi:DNA-binding transcriptional activator of the SARP family
MVFIKRFFIFVILIFLYQSEDIFASESIDYGLHFKSYSVLAKDRTGLVLENNEFIRVDKELVLSFDILYRQEIEFFGSILRIISESSSFLSLGFSAAESTSVYPILIVNDEVTPVNDYVTYNKWFNIKIIISNKDQTITFKCDDISKTVKIKENDWRKIKICFGQSSIPGFMTEEVPPINLKNVKLSRNEKLIRNWVLNEHAESVCYDEIEHIKALVYNPEWIIDSYTKWNESKSFSFDKKNIHYAFDESSGIIYIVADEKQIIAYNTRTSTDTIIDVKGGKWPPSYTNQLIFNPLTRELLSYSLEDKLISTFSFETQTWSGTQALKTDPNYWHHTASFRHEDYSIVTFGGYGHHQYKNDLITIGISDKSFRTQKLPSIFPRFSSASVIVNDTLFIFGGEGNSLGKQEINTSTPTDLYAVDLKTSKVSLIWEIPDISYGLPCGNMIYNSDESCFYVLVNTKKAKQALLKISKTEPVVKELSYISSLELRADYNFFTLMRSIDEGVLHALYCRIYKSKETQIDLYNIQYPPIAQEQTLQNPLTEKTNPIQYVFILVLLIIFFGITFLILRRRSLLKKAPPKEYIIKASEEDGMNETIIKKTFYNRSVKMLSLLGIFNVKSEDGEDITNQFTPVLKNIILAVILNSNEKASGINTKILDNLIWPDKDDKSARNNRNVSLNRLNQVLEKIGEVQVINDNSFLKLKMNDSTFCDYLCAQKLISYPIKQILNDSGLTEQLLELLSYGQLLPFTKEEWLDPYKAAYSDAALDFLMNILILEKAIQQVDFRLQISNLIFLFDSLSEEALSLKCQALHQQGKKSLAKNAYNSFCKEYETLLGEKFTKPLSEIIGFQ